MFKLTYSVDNSPAIRFSPSLFFSFTDKLHVYEHFYQKIKMPPNI